MEYNTERNHLINPEYGRSIQKMVDYALTIEDRDKRTKTANAIINVMAILQPIPKETPEYRIKLWDHLHIISDFKLDVDSPYPIPEKKDKTDNGIKISYPHKVIDFPHYGNNMLLLIEQAASYPDGEQKDNLIKAIANHMKKLYLIWNRDSVDDEVIIKNLRELSKGKIALTEDFKFTTTRDILTKPVAVKKKKNKFKQRF